MVDGLEDLDIEFLGSLRVEWHMECHEGVGLTLHANPDRAVVHVGATGLRDRVVADVDMVDVEGHDLGDIVKSYSPLTTKEGRAREARLQTAVSSGDEYSMISVQRFDDLMVPRIF
jgi:hypothetical protein